MKTKKMSLDNMQGKLSRTEMKNLMAGDDPIGTIGAPKCGHDISCDGHSEYTECGTNHCTCAYVEGGGNILYCRSGWV